MGVQGLLVESKRRSGGGWVTPLPVGWPSEGDSSLSQKGVCGGVKEGEDTHKFALISIFNIYSQPCF